MLSGLILTPILVWGQDESPTYGPQIITPPVNMTVCHGQSLTFTSVVKGGYSGWLINGSEELPPQLSTHASTVNTKKGYLTYLKATFPSSSPAEFNGTKIQSVLLPVDGQEINSAPAYLTYISNLAYSVAGLIATWKKKAELLLEWDSRDDSNYYLVEIRDLSGTDDPVANKNPHKVTDHHFAFLPKSDDHCYYYQCQVAAVQIVHPECNEVRSVGESSVIVMEPDISPVSAQFTDHKLRIDWTQVDDSPSRIIITDLNDRQRTHTVIYNGSPPYFYSIQPEACGEFNMTVQVTPVRCKSPAFTHGTNTRFQIECQPSVTDNSSGIASTTEAKPTSTTEADPLNIPARYRTAISHC